MFESLITSFELPDGTTLAQLRDRGDGQISTILRAAPLLITDENPAAATIAAFHAVKDLALQHGWDWGKLTSDLILQDIFIHRTYLEEIFFQYKGHGRQFS